MRRAVALFAALIMLALTLACGSGSGAGSGATSAAPAPTTASTGGAAPTEAAAPTQPPAATGPAKVGDKVTSGPVALTVVKATRAAQIGTIQKAGDGKEYVIAEVLIEATEKAPYNLLYFKIKDGTGVEYTPTISTDPGALKSGELPPGDKVRGTVAFELPKGAAGLVLSYQPIQFGAGDPIRVALD